MADKNEPRNPQPEQEPGDIDNVDVCVIGGDVTPPRKVSTLHTGAKRDGYFKKRDYE